jgi:hypothetical protein
MQAISTQSELTASAVSIHKNLKPEIDVKEVLRFLGARKGSAPARTVKKIKSFIDQSKDMLEPMVLESELNVLKSENGNLVLSPRVELKSRKLSRTFKDCDTAKVFVATVGKKIENRINELMEDNRTAEASILDAIASVAVEDTIESFHSRVDLKLKSRSRCATLRFSPGYCDWDIKEQKKLFNLVDASRIGVTLSDNSLMSPRKSISGIFGIGQRGKLAGKTNNPCMQCGKKDCNARRTEN